MWLLGDNVGNQVTYFKEEVKPRTETNSHDVLIAYPGSRAGAAFWADHTGIGWMFGGMGFDDYGSEHAHILQDLWSFSVLRNKWTQVDTGHAGPKPSQSEVHPGPRHRAAACGVHRLAFAAFGGEDQDGRLKNDTWVFDIPSKMWLPLVNVKGPASRRDMAYWCDKSKIIIFGGEGENNNMLADMWEFSLRHFEWKRVETKGSTVPLGRNGAATWKGHAGNLYMYGGQRIEKEEHGVKFSLLSDLWVYNLKNNSWRLVHGDVTGQIYASYGYLGKGNKNNTPGPRMHSAYWIVEDNLWLYGGLGCGDGTKKCHTHSMLADLWMFKLSTSQWVWQGGSKLLDTPPQYGQRGRSNNSNLPGSRSGSMALSHEGVGYLFGGIGQDGRYRTSFLNDLWILRKVNKTYVFTTEKSWLHGIQPGLVFLMILASIAGIALSFGAIFFLKKMLEYSRHRTNTGDFKVRYSPISQEATLET